MQDCDSLIQVLDTHIVACVAASASSRSSSTALPECPVDDTFYVAPRELAASDSVVAVHQRERAEITKAIMVRGIIGVLCCCVHGLVNTLERPLCGCHLRIRPLFLETVCGAWWGGRGGVSFPMCSL